MNIILFVMAAWCAVSSLICIAQIGKPRKPLDPATAVVLVLINAAWATALVVAALRLA